MSKIITDVHTHSNFSPDGYSALEDMLKSACEMGVEYFGVSEHFDYENGKRGYFWADEKKYFPTARDLQKRYEGKLNFLVGAEIGYTPNKNAHWDIQNVLQEYKPDFVVNSVHGMSGLFDGDPNGKARVYGKYLSAVEESLDVPYHYDIVGHLGFIARYAEYEDRKLTYREFKPQLDRIFKKVIEKGKILEVNSKLAPARFEGDPYLFFTPDKSVLKAYYEAGGRKVSYASDAHGVRDIARNREMVVERLKEIGFTHLTVPCQGEHIEIEL